jgi:hypothetical protein
MHLPRDVNAIIPDMILRLVENGVPENLWIDYKETILGNSNDEKKDFLSDVSAFANTVGGHLIYGIRAIDGVPNEIVGLPGIQPDPTILRLENLLRDSIEPRIPGVGMRYIQIDGDKGVFVISVSRSWVQPHSIRVGQGTFRFYGRNSAGAYPLSLDELRSLFGQTGDLMERVRRFRLERASLIAAGEGTRVIRRRDESDDRFRSVILHIVPLATFEDFSVFDSRMIRQNPEIEQWLTTLLGRTQRGYSFDGTYTFDNADVNSAVQGYVQVFGNGAVEVADMYLFRHETNRQVYALPSPDIERLLIDKVLELCRFYQAIQVSAPIALMLTIFGADGYPIGYRRGHGFVADEQRIRQSPLFFPDLVLEDTNPIFEQVAVRMKPLFDRLWNAAGYDKCPYFTFQGGEWRVATSLLPI